MLVIHYYILTNNYKRQGETPSFFLSMLLQGTGKIGPYLACKAPMINCTRQGVAHSVTVSWQPHKACAQGPYDPHVCCLSFQAWISELPEFSLRLLVPFGTAL